MWSTTPLHHTSELAPLVAASSLGLAVLAAVAAAWMAESDDQEPRPREGLETFVLLAFLGVGLWLAVKAVEAGTPTPLSMKIMLAAAGLGTAFFSMLELQRERHKRDLEAQLDSAADPSETIDIDAAKLMACRLGAMAFSAKRRTRLAALAALAFTIATVVVDRYATFDRSAAAREEAADRVLLLPLAAIAFILGGVLADDAWTRHRYGALQQESRFTQPSRWLAVVLSAGVVIATAVSVAW